ncbi:nitric oxide reductase activation protein NorD [[Mycobacterium] nativiensis]|uniref:MorD protein n=1 Tax=[Mycobacterium] nativiensis TaxID=2855503 RepID=A0ABU5XPV3_9MYCO|nr:MorD protein [Mycolicibacter sp. MYC340]MEB3030009.1 MorD protein [Mycolicibacter sp. MYC340]
MNPLELESSCALTAVALSDRRRDGARLVTGAKRGFGVTSTLSTVEVPYPMPPDWTRRTLTGGVALQCSPSKERIAAYHLAELTSRELRALTFVEAQVALGWVGRRWPGLLPELRRRLANLEPCDPDLSANEMFDRAIELARARGELAWYPLVGTLPRTWTASGSLTESIRRIGRMPWSSTQKRRPRAYSVPVGGEGGVRNTSLPPPSRPDEDDGYTSAERRPGIPYPEWNAHSGRFLPDHVAVVEHAWTARRGQHTAARMDLRKWFEQSTARAMTNGLEDGSDLDVDAYVSHHLDTLTGECDEPRLFRELLPAGRDVATALLLDASSSLGVHGGRLFRLELACADALSGAMTRAHQRHGVFAFTGNTRHHVAVHCLKDFGDRRLVAPSDLGLLAGGYTRLGAPLRHLTSRLIAQPSQRRLLIVIGDGLMSDEGYEGRYAWADVAHAVEEANEAGVCVYYVGVGPVRVDPLPEVFGQRCSRRIRRIEELPRVLAHVHRELVAA